MSGLGLETSLAGRIKIRLSQTREESDFGIDNAALLDLNEYSVLRGTTLPVYTVAAQRIDP